MAQRLGMGLLEFQQLLGELHGLDLGSLQPENSEEFDEAADCHLPAQRAGGKSLLSVPAVGTEVVSGRGHELARRERTPGDGALLPGRADHEGSRSVLGIGESRVSQLHSLALVRLRARLQELMQSRGAARQGRRAHPERPGVARRTREAGKAIREIGRRNSPGRNNMEGTSHNALLDAAALQAGALNAAELAALRVKARKSASAVRPAAQSAVAAFDPRLVGRPTDAQLQGLEPLHKNCARKIARALGVLAARERGGGNRRRRAVFRRGTARKTPRRGLPRRLGPGPRRDSPAASRPRVRVPPPGPPPRRHRAGSPGGARTHRNRAGNLRPLGGALAQALREAWEPAVKFEAPGAGARPVAPAEAAAFFRPPSRCSRCRLKCAWQETPGRLLLAFPSAIAAALLRRFTAAGRPAPRPASAGQRRLRERLLEGRFEAELLLPSSTVSSASCAGCSRATWSPSRCAPTNCCRCGRGAGNVSGLAGALRNQRGAQVQQVLSIVPKEEEERA